MVKHNEESSKFLTIGIEGNDALFVHLQIAANTAADYAQGQVI